MTGVAPYNEFSKEEIEARYLEGDFFKTKSLGLIRDVILGCW
jgi:hypothetical protein